MNTVNFKALPVGNPQIKKLLNDGSYENISSALIKTEQQDYNNISKLDNLWKYKYNLVNKMLEDVQRIRSYEAQSLYVLTEQTENFNDISPEMCLGMFEISEFDNKIRFNYVQTRPDCVYGEENRMYKEIGYSMLKCFIDKCPFTEFQTYALKGIEKFYKMLGFELIDESSGYMVKQSCLKKLNLIPTHIKII